MKYEFFSRQAMTNILFVLHSTYTWHTPCRDWSDLDKSLTRRNRPTFKIQIANIFEIIANFRMQY